VADELLVRALVLDDGETRVGWAVCDLLEVDRSLVADVRAELSGETVVVSATHTHAGPDLGAAPDGYREWLPHAVAGALRAAAQDLSPVRLHWAEDAVTGVAANRRDPERPVPPLGLLAATSPTGSRTTMVVYPCHATVLGPGNLEVSGDLVGAAVRALGGRSAWAQGAAGAISTRGYRRERTLREVERLGARIAAAAKDMAARSRPLSHPTLSVQTAEVALPLKQATEAAGGQIAPREEDDRSDEALLEEARAARSLRSRTEDVAELSLLQIGDLRLLFVPGEPFDSIEHSLRRPADSGPLRVVGYSNGAPGYVFCPEDEARGGYEVLASPLTGEAGARIVDAAARMLNVHSMEV
jgi:hypothetical protein